MSAPPPEIALQTPDAAAFAPFGRLIHPPATAGRRAFYSDALQPPPPGTSPVLHVNHVLPSDLPLTVTGLERHPHAAQVFIPLDVARYIVLVTPADTTGAPDTTRALAFVLPGTTGIIYAPNVWHMGATVLDRPGHFTVLMHRGGAREDDEFRTIAPLQIVKPDTRHPKTPKIATEVSN